MEMPKNQTNGALNAPTSIYDIIGYKHSPYKTSNVEVYLHSINTMHPSDLEAHAMEVGVAPNDNREQLIASLEKAFLTYQGMFNSARQPAGVKMTAEDAAIAEKIMKRGK